MRKLALLAILAVGVWGCGDTGTSDGRSGSGGSGGTAGSGGAVEIPASTDTTCRAYCANEPGGVSCGMNGSAPGLSGGDTVKLCYENCLASYEQEASLASACEEEWIAILDCYVDLDCDDLFGDCDPAVQAYSGCNPGEPFSLNLVYCDNPDVAAPSCDLTGYSMQDDSALAAKLGGCAVGGCHLSPAATSWTMDLSGSVEGALSTLTVAGGTGGYFLVDDADPDCSLLLSEVTPLPIAGVRMPVTGSFWNSAEIDCFRSYLHEMYPQ